MPSPPAGLRAGIIDHVIARIRAGIWVSGDRVPSESQFMAQFGASRMTVHHALRDLSTQGHIVRRKGHGSYVATPQSYVAHYDHQDIAAEIAAGGAHHTARVVAQQTVTADADLATRFGCPIGTALFHAIIVHSADGSPIELEERHVNPLALPHFVDLDLGNQTIFASLMLTRPDRQGSESIRPILCTADDAALLGCAPGTLALELFRRTWTIDGPVTCARLLRIGDHARMTGIIARTIHPSHPIAADSALPGPQRSRA